MDRSPQPWTPPWTPPEYLPARFPKSFRLCLEGARSHSLCTAPSLEKSACCCQVHRAVRGENRQY